MSKREEQEKLLEEFLRLKPSRAMDRLLSEYQVEKSYSVYQLLQEKIKKNTSELRTTLTEKYQNLVDCSNLLGTIKIFTDDIQSIEKEISAVFGGCEGQVEKISGKRSKVSSIEQKIYKKKYGEAMIDSYQIKDGEVIDESEILYLPFLRIQILEALQGQLISRKFTKQFISDILRCLHFYLQHLTAQQQHQILSNQSSQLTLLSLIAQSITQHSSSSLITQNGIIQIIFRCKLLSLSCPSTPKKQQQLYISKFFKDIYQLIHEKQHDSLQIQHLASIFCKNIQQIQRHLSETFIINSDDIISFRYQLYEKLLGSDQFMGVLDKLYEIIRENYQDVPERSLREGFVNLWQNYYLSLLEILFDKCDPLKLMPKHKIQKGAGIPKQISKYMISEEISPQLCLQTYQATLQHFLANISELLKRSHQLSSSKSSKIDSSQMIAEITKIYVNKLEEINIKLQQFCQSITVEPSTQKLKSMILLFLLGDQFNNQVLKFTQINQGEHLEGISAHKMKWNEQNLKKFGGVFAGCSKKWKNNWSVNFDQFFMEYHTQYLKKEKSELIKRVILLLIEAMMEEIEPQGTKEFVDAVKNKIIKKEKAEADKKNKIRDLDPKAVSSVTFAKKKIIQSL